ncbi:MAG: hypothetical protein ACRD5L_12105, partial [Bryobacteraceae bacterium]
MTVAATNSVENKVKALAAFVFVPPFRTLVRYSGSDALRRFVWNSVSRRLIVQSHPFVSRTRFGFRFAGNSQDIIPRYIYYFGIWEPGISEWICS